MAEKQYSEEPLEPHENARIRRTLDTEDRLTWAGNLFKKFLMYFVALMAAVLAGWDTLKRVVLWAVGVQ